MNRDPYRELARRLDAFPIGFPATPGGVELRLLAKVYQPEEAALAAVMTRTPEPPAQIAERAALDAGVVLRRLAAMARKGLIRAYQRPDGPHYALAQFVGVVYELQLPRMDAELAGLFEQYYRESRGATMIYHTPPVHRIIPVEESVPAEMEILPQERASELVGAAKSWAVRDCICRVQQRLIGKACSHPLDVCLLFAPVVGVFEGSQADRPISQVEALELLRRAEDAGLVHCVYNYRDGLHHICNCCTCACMFLRGVAEFGRLSGVARSSFRCALDPVLCIGCGDCMRRCQFGALSLTAEVCAVDHLRCMGCGLCCAVCPAGALSLAPLAPGETVGLLPDSQAWLTERLRDRPAEAA